MPTVTVDNDGYFTLNGLPHVFIKGGTGLHISNRLFKGKTINYRCLGDKYPAGFEVRINNRYYYCMNVPQATIFELKYSDV